MDEKEIEKLMKEYENVEIPEGLFDLDEVFRKGDIIKKRRKIIKNTVRVAAVFIIAIIITIVILMKPKSPDEVTQQSEVPIETEDVRYQKEIFAENKGKGIVNQNYIKKVYSIKLKKILEYSSITKDNDTYPITKVEAEILNHFSGEEVGDIIFWIPGGIWTVEDLKASDFVYDAEEIKVLANNENIYVKYFENVKLAKPKVNKTYLVTLKEESTELYVELNSKYGFKEYNPDTNSILNANDEWETVNMNEYLK